MENTLESFINFCDEMQIAEEGFKDTKVFSIIEKGWTAIKKAIKSLFARISSFLIKVRSKGDKILVNNEFYNIYSNLEINIKHRNDMDSTKKKEYNAKIDELLEKSYKPTGDGGNTISISDIESKLKNVTNDLNRLNKEADKALAQLKVARNKLNAEKQKNENVKKESENLELGNVSDSIVKNHNSNVDVSNATYSFDNAKNELEKANAEVYSCQLRIKLYTGLRNKLVPDSK